jgi:prevent-host-death family protein
MQEIDALQAENSLEVLLDRVERGEEIVITRQGMPVARLVPYEGAFNNRPLAQAALERIRARARNVRAGEFSCELLKSDRDSGRP